MMTRKKYLIAARTIDGAVERLKAKVDEDDEIRGGWEAVLLKTSVSQCWDNRDEPVIEFEFEVSG